MSRGTYRGTLPRPRRKPRMNGATMSDKYADEGKGRLKEAAGSLTGVRISRRRAKRTRPRRR